MGYVVRVGEQLTDIQAASVEFRTADIEGAKRLIELALANRHEALVYEELSHE